MLPLLPPPPPHPLLCCSPELRGGSLKTHSQRLIASRLPASLLRFSYSGGILQSTHKGNEGLGRGLHAKACNSHRRPSSPLHYSLPPPRFPVSLLGLWLPMNMDYLHKQIARSTKLAQNQFEIPQWVNKSGGWGRSKGQERKDWLG